MIRKLLFLLMLCVTTIGAWAGDGYTITSGENYDLGIKLSRINITTPGSLSSAIAELSAETNKVSIKGELNADDISALSSLNVTTIDLQYVTNEEAFTFTNSDVVNVVLPQKWTKAEVNAAAVALGSNFGAAVSYKQSVVTRDGYVYTDPVTQEEKEYTGAVTDGKGQVSVVVPYNIVESAFSYNNETYTGEKFVADGKTYGSDESNVISVASAHGFTYTDGTKKVYDIAKGIYTDGEGHTYGYTGSNSAVNITLNTPISATYNSGKYIYEGTPIYVNINNSSQGVGYEGGTEYEYVKATGFNTINIDGKDYVYEGATFNENGLQGNWGGTPVTLLTKEGFTYNNDPYAGKTRTDNGNTYGNTGTPVSLFQKDAMTYDNNGTKTIYTGETRIDGETLRGSLGTLVELEQVSVLKYERWSQTWDWDNSRPTREADGKLYGNAGGDAITLSPVATNSYYFQTNINGTWIPNGYYEGEVEERDGNYYATINGAEVQVTPNTQYNYYYTATNGYKTYYETESYQKVYSKDETFFGYTNGDEVEIYSAAKYVYNDGANEYKGNVFGTNTGYINGDGTPAAEIVITSGPTDFYNDGENDVLYTGYVYSDNTGYINGNDVQLTAATITYYKDSEDNDVVYTGKTYSDGKGYIGGTIGYVYASSQTGYYIIDENTKVAYGTSYIASHDGKEWVNIGGTPTEVAVVDNTVNYYTDNEGHKVIYNGLVFATETQNLGYEDGNTYKALITEEDYKLNGETVYTGILNAEGTKGLTDQNSKYELEAAYVYNYTDPSTGTTVRFPAEGTTTEFIANQTFNNVEVAVTPHQFEDPSGKVALTAYVNTPGTLRDAIFAISDGVSTAVDGSCPQNVVLGTVTQYTYALTKVKEITLSGTVNGKDVAGADDLRFDDNGHLLTKRGVDIGMRLATPEKSTDVGNKGDGALNGASFTKIDYSDVALSYDPSDAAEKLAAQNDMAFGLLGTLYNNVTEFILPRSETYYRISESAFSGCQQFKTLCIPENVKELGASAFKDDNAIELIYTRNSDGTYIVNGITYQESELSEALVSGNFSMTLPRHLVRIEEGCFSNSKCYRDVYVTNPNTDPVPYCEPFAFDSQTLYGWGGYKGGHPITAESYGIDYTKTEIDHAKGTFAILHFPNDASEDQIQLYQDITRVYSVVDEAGNTDGDGQPLRWPTQVEWNRSYQQANSGYLWDDWTKNLDAIINTKPVDSRFTHTDNGKTFTGLNSYSSDEYYGADLDLINTFAPKKRDDSPITEESFLETYYTWIGWHQFVLSSTYHPAARPGEVQRDFSKFKKNQWYTICLEFNMTRSQLIDVFGARYDAENEKYVDGVKITKDMLPQVATLKGVTRNYDNNRITLYISHDLMEQGFEFNNDHEFVKRDYTSDEMVDTDGDGTPEDPIVIKRGWPYLIRPYFPTETPSGTRPSEYVCSLLPVGDNDYSDVRTNLKRDYYVKAKKTQNNTTTWETVEEGKVGGVDIPQPEYELADGTAETGNKEYRYYFIGSFFQHALPVHTYYISGGKFYYYNEAVDGWYWNPNVCIIGAKATPTLTVTNTTTDASNVSMNFLPQDDWFIKVDQAGNAKKYAPVFGMSFEDDETVTGVNEIELDGKTYMVEHNSNCAVYNTNGQYVGNSTNNLAKGIYMVNGKKLVVK